MKENRDNIEKFCRNVRLIIMFVVFRDFRIDSVSIQIETIGLAIEDVLFGTLVSCHEEKKKRDKQHMYKIIGHIV